MDATTRWPDDPMHGQPRQLYTRSWAKAKEERGKAAAASRAPVSIPPKRWDFIRAEQTIEKRQVCRCAGVWGEFGALVGSDAAM